MRDRGARRERVNRVGNAETEVLVAVNLDRLLEPLDSLLDHVVDGLRRGDAERIGECEGVHVAFGGHTLDDVQQSLDLGARGVDGKEHGIETRLFRGDGRLDRGLHGSVAGPSVGPLDQVIAGGNLNDHALAPASLDHLDFFGDAAPEGKNFRLEAQVSDLGNGCAVLVGNRGHARLDALDA